MTKLPLSVFIIAKNEADRIDKPILSTRDWAEEVIVVDSGSEDETVTVANNLGARVIFNEWPGYGPQKRFAEAQCKHNWLLNIDADEEVSPELKASIQRVFADGKQNDANEPVAYRVKHKTLFQHENKPPFFAPSGKVIRLYRKDKARFKDSIVHDSVLVEDGKVGTLKGLLYHRSFRSLEHWAGKINSYSSMQAEDYLKRGRKPSRLRLLLEPTLAFWKAYILRGWCFYGIDGITASRLYAFGRMLRMAKIRESARIKIRDK